MAESKAPPFIIDLSKGEIKNPDLVLKDKATFAVTSPPISSHEMQEILGYIPDDPDTPAEANFEAHQHQRHFLFARTAGMGLVLEERQHTNGKSTLFVVGVTPSPDKLPQSVAAEGPVSAPSN